MFVLVRAVIYAALFIGLVLIFVPARLLSWSGIVRPAAIQVQQVAGMVVGTAGAVIALWCIVTLAAIGRGTPAPFDPPRRLVIKGPYRFVRNPMYIGAGVALASRCRFSVTLASSFSQLISSWCGTRSPLYGEPSGKNTKHTAARSGDGGRAYEPFMILLPPDTR
jgi:protein-S-isoprenylcysteine O-methyltransferase Ste14